eukprot:4535416-Pleurochrysis_carterae.AAC.1
MQKVRLMLAMPLTQNEVLERLRNAGDTLVLGKLRIPRGSDSRLDVSCGCSLTRPGVLNEFVEPLAMRWERPCQTSPCGMGNASML